MRKALLLGMVLAFGFVGVGDSKAVGPGPTEAQTARGLGFYLHAPPAVAPSGLVRIMVETYGFPSVLSPVVLPGASVAAGWEHDDAAADEARAVSDAEGHAILELPVPVTPDSKGTFTLLITVSRGGHTRTQHVSFKAEEQRSLSLHVADRDLTAGDSVIAWALARDGSAPAEARSVRFRLLERGVPRFERDVTTDAKGLARIDFPVPREAGHAAKFTLEVTDRGSTAVEELQMRSEVAAVPQLFVFTEQARLRPGGQTAFHVTVRDTAGEPMRGVSLQFWAGRDRAPDEKVVGPRPEVLITDSEGVAHGTLTAPKLLAPGKTSTISGWISASLEGRTLGKQVLASVDSAAHSVDIVPEAGALIPGVAQTLHAHVEDAQGQVVSGKTFQVLGDGLDQRITTNAEGDAEFSWTPPLGVGASRSVGPCASGVAAQVTVRADVDTFQTCVAVDREASGLLDVSPAIVRAGESVTVRLRQPKPTADAFSVAARGPQNATLGGWSHDGKVQLTVPATATGLFNVSAALPGHGDHTAKAAFVVLPRIEPRLSIRIAETKLRPSTNQTPSFAEVDVALTDSAGKPITGSVAVARGDRNEGGTLQGVWGLDYRTALCGNVPFDRCAAFLTPGSSAWQRASLSTRASVQEPYLDPKRTARAELDATFAHTLRSLEGAIYEASNARDALHDVYRLAPNKTRIFNPELLTLVTAAMESPPLTPGGEVFTLSDLSRVDRQVTYDTVARRVGRLKLFHALIAVRTAIKDLDRDEPAFQQPQALLGRLLRDGKIAETDLLDPWGGTIQFVRVSAAPTTMIAPFLPRIHGFELHAPGPDGVAGTADDIRDPFERVVQSKTPYAIALNEDRIVDAKYELEVAETSIDAWKTLLERETGMELGGSFGAGGLGLGGMGSGGGGSGSGRLGGAHRTRDAGRTLWMEPVRTDAQGRAHLRVPMGMVETKWLLGFVAFPDASAPIVETRDVSTSLPLSIHVQTGDLWTLGDKASIPVTIRNRTGLSQTVALSIGAQGAVTLLGIPPKQVQVASNGETTVWINVHGRQVGEGTLTARVTAAGKEDTLVHTWSVAPAAAQEVVTAGGTVVGEREIQAILPQGVTLRGTPRVVITRGVASHLRTLLGSMAAGSAQENEEIVGAAAKIERWAHARGDEETAARARTLRTQAFAQVDAKTSPWEDRARALLYAPPGASLEGQKPGDCPPEMLKGTPLALDAEDVGDSDAAKGATACWDNYANAAVEGLMRKREPVQTARALLALVQRPHRAPLAQELTRLLLRDVELNPDGSSAYHERASRRDRVMVYSALFAARRFLPSPKQGEALLGMVLADSEAGGGYADARTTMAVVQALLSADVKPTAGTLNVALRALDTERTIAVQPDSVNHVLLPVGATSVFIRSSDVVSARIEVPTLRSWLSPREVHSGLSAEVQWPQHSKVGASVTVNCVLRSSDPKSQHVTLELPLPPGAFLRESVGGVTQSGGRLYIERTLVGNSMALALPLGFSFAGSFTVPEGRMGTNVFASIPARQLVVQ